MTIGTQTVPKEPSTPTDTEVNPDPKLEKRTRRKFKPEYKLRIIEEANEYKHGELGALLRRENLYSNQLADWRKEYAENGFDGLAKSAPGPTPSKTADERLIEKLQKENAKLKSDLQTANDCVDIQKKVLSILDRSNNGNTQ